MYSVGGGFYKVKYKGTKICLELFTQSYYLKITYLFNTHSWSFTKCQLHSRSCKTKQTK